MQHVVWDWNGTLFADQHVVLEALNAVLADTGLSPVDLETYRRAYTRPVRRFYERLFDRPIDDAEWEHLDEIYHEAYRRGLQRAGLDPHAAPALDVTEELGRTQSLLSMWRHHELIPLVDRLGLDDRFARVDGLRGPAGGRKAPHLRAHLDRLAHLHETSEQVLVIGDALDDAAAAQAVGARCVLYDGGAHPREELESAGVPVAATLTEALERGGLG